MGEGSCYILDGKSVIDKFPGGLDGVTHLLQFVAAAPNVDTYTINNGTGVITMDGAYNDYGLVNYAEANAAAGEKLISNDSLAIPHQDVTIIARAWDPELELTGSVVFVFEACEIIQEPGHSLSMEAANVATVRFNVGGNIKKSVYVA